MSKYTYEGFKQLVSIQQLPCAVLSVGKAADGNCGEIKYIAVNEPFFDNNFSLYSANSGTNISREEFVMEGRVYSDILPKEPKFENICFRTAWLGEHFHSYIDTTRMYGMWTENILLPLGVDEENAIAYFELFITLTKQMEAGKFSIIPPDIASFVIKSCLMMKEQEDFTTAMDIVTKEILEDAKASSACIFTVSPDLYKSDILSECVRDNAYKVKDVFSDIPFEILEQLEWLCGETDCIIVKDESDFAYYEEKAPDCANVLRKRNIQSLCLVPFVHQNAIIGYLYITNFDISKLKRLKDLIELMSFFLAAEVANHMIMARLEYLSTIDLLTGVYNRNCMNVNIDESATKLLLNPKPFNVAFCDLNGLKSINDNDGHDNGDQLLKDASSLLKLVFKHDEIYRSGGDEFTIVSMNSTKEEFEEKIAALREEASDPDWLHFAIGYYCDPIGKDLRLALRYADEAMLKDKAKYYDEHPEKRR